MTLYLDYNGTPTPIADLFWMQRSACGCLSGATTAEHGDDGPILDADAARSEFNSGLKTLIARSIEDGETYELVDRAWYTSHLDEFTSKCPHDPKWGVAKVAAPEGYVWAAASPTRSLRHIVPASAIGNWRDKPAPICGSRARRGTWGAEWHDLADTVTCRKCEAKAQVVAP